MAEKYRGSTTYVLVYAELANAARYQGLTTYQAIAQIMGLPLRGSYMGHETGVMLDEINEDELANGRPLLTAVCVGATGMPGSGFFKLAHKVGRYAGHSPADQESFWEAERAAVYEAWKRQFKSEP